MKAITDNYRTYLMDLNDTDDIAPIVEDVVKTYGHIDGLVNNADRNDNLDLDHTSWREFEQSLHGNLTHYYELAHRCAPYLRESKGAIVDISSKTALTARARPAPTPPTCSCSTPPRASTSTTRSSRTPSTS